MVLPAFVYLALVGDGCIQLPGYPLTLLEALSFMAALAARDILEGAEALETKKRRISRTICG